MEILKQCDAQTKAGTQCKLHVSKLGETKCPKHGGLKKDGTKSEPTSKTVKHLCAGLTKEGEPCKNHVKVDGALCHIHDPEHVPKAKFSCGKMTLAMLTAYTNLENNSMMQDIVKWYLKLAELEQQKTIDDADLASWFVEGYSNANGSSFAEKHDEDPVTFLVDLPEMKPYKDLILDKFDLLAKTNKVVELFRTSHLHNKPQNSNN